ncbi:MAG: PDZ domain-containing protein [Planctomycetota bacterium]
MSITSWKRTLTLLNITAVLGMAGTVYGYMQHRSFLGEPAVKYAFAPEKGPGGNTRYPSTDAIGVMLGAPFVEPDKNPTKVDDGPKEAASGPKMKDLFQITSAVAMEPPYGEEGARPTLVIEFLKGGGEPKTLRLGNGIEGRFDPKRLYLGEIPVKYKFIGCRPDKNNPYLYHFWFDVHCDGKNLQSLTWIGQPPDPTHTYVDPLSGAIVESSNEHGSVAMVPDNADLIPVPEGPGAVGTGELPDVAPTKEPNGKAAAEPPNTGKTDAATAPKSKPTVIEPFVAQEKAKDYWDVSDKGVREISARGLKDLRDMGFKGVLKNVKTKSYKGPDGKEGIRIARIGKSSPARGFGVREEDVILSVNNRAVKSQRDAIRVVKDEINNRKKNILSVRILRGGKEITQNYDIRDPKSRRAARDYARGRR